MALATFLQVLASTYVLATFRFGAGRPVVALQIDRIVPTVSLSIEFFSGCQLVHFTTHQTLGFNQLVGHSNPQFRNPCMKAKLSTY